MAKYYKEQGRLYRAHIGMCGGTYQQMEDRALDEIAWCAQCMHVSMYHTP
jgi:hypothetical protein